MKLDFYYYSYQCPLNDDMVQLLNEYKDKLDICYHDIANDFRIAKEMKMFFPTLVVLDNKKRYYSPIRRSFLEQVVIGEYPEEKPYLPSLSRKAVTKYIEPINRNNVGIACDCCGNKTKSNWCKKAQFLMTNMAEPYGFIHKDEAGCLIGGAEYLQNRSSDLRASRSAFVIPAGLLSASGSKKKASPWYYLELSCVFLPISRYKTYG